MVFNTGLREVLVVYTESTPFEIYGLLAIPNTVQTRKA